MLLEITNNKSIETRTRSRLRMTLVNAFGSSSTWIVFLKKYFYFETILFLANNSSTKLQKIIIFLELKPIQNSKKYFFKSKIIKVELINQKIYIILFKKNNNDPFFFILRKTILLS